MKIKSIKMQNIKKLIQKNQGSVFVSYNDTYTIKTVLKFACDNNYNVVGGVNLNTELNTTDFKQHFEQMFYKHFHGNSKPIIVFSYNFLNKKYEIQFGTKTVYSSYPQLKNMPIYYIL